jgi:two-component system nitrate/nitrite response regulator NarL
MGIRILIADRHDMFREAVRRVLESEPEFSVVADTGDAERLVDLIKKHKPDVLLLDLKLRKRTGIDALREIDSLGIKICPILLTDTNEKGEIVEALRWGARGVFWKSDPTNLLFKCIHKVLGGEYWISRSGICELVRDLRMLAAKVDQGSQFKVRSLTPQQRQIVDAIVAGCSNKEIARELSVSERTVKYHLTRIFGKLGVSGRMQLARFTLGGDFKDVLSK